SARPRTFSRFSKPCRTQAQAIGASTSPGIAARKMRVKIALTVIAMVLQALALCNAYAHGDHKPKHGGIMGRGDDAISVELVMEKGTATLYIEDEGGAPLATEEVKGTLSLASPGRPAQERNLIPAG